MSGPVLEPRTSLGAVVADHAEFLNDRLVDPLGADPLRLAYHESGHVLAIAMWDSIQSIEYVTLEPNERSWGHVRQRGFCVYHPRRGPAPRGMALWQRRGLALCAVRTALGGYAAEEVFSGEPVSEIESWWDAEEDTDEYDACVAIGHAFKTANLIGADRRLRQEYALTRHFLAVHRTVLSDLAHALLTSGILFPDAICGLLAGRLDYRRWANKGLPRMPRRRRTTARAA